jgi:hypothetical protein
MNKYTIGADIECFLADKETNEIVSAEGIIKGTKWQPFIFDEANEFFSTSLDNVMAEHCIPPTDNVGDWVSGILKARNYIESLDNKLCTAFIPSARLADKWLQTENANIFGCEPDFNAWLDGEMNPPVEKSIYNLRTAGFHVHVGYDNPSIKMNVNIMKFFDVYLTLPSLLIEPDNERRQMYGKAGAFRNKNYGMEARTLSSFFASEEKYMTWVFEQTNFFVPKVLAGEQLPEELLLLTEQVINNNDKLKAEELCIKNNITICA